ncbi:MAG: hypothetical protein A3G21_25400 [Acidobacteria bacterium RIFCSPLOWO2_12_FULL_66_21]|nr:MAG: hypothetical protein A3G21_25400 [Acidobacteria bacterium RIFCSPLOWO2_12_FULL_66_21]
MAATSAFRDGIRRVNGAPAVLLGMFAVTLLVALPLSFALRGMLAAHLGPSLAAGTALSGTNYAWWQEFSAQASGLATTFVPSIIGFGAVLDNLSALLDNLPLATTIAGATAAWLVIWSFLSGGVLDRYARQRATRAHGFFAACGVHFWRFVRLGVIAWLAYAFLFGYVHRWIFTGAFGWLTRDVTVERTAFLIRLGGYALFGVLLVLCTIVFDYARVRTVVEDRRSAIGALAAGMRFAWRNAGAALTLYALNAAAFLVLVLLYALASPGTPGAGWAMWLALGLGEVYILARHYLKLLFYASETSLFQSRLAHAAYTAAPAVEWPDSPAAESIASAGPAARF